MSFWFIFRKLQLNSISVTKKTAVVLKNNFFIDFYIYIKM